MQNWAMCNKVLAYEVFFLRSNGIYLLRYLLNPRYNHDKIRREFRQQRQKIGILHFHCRGYFFYFSGIIFLTQKGPCRSHFCERQRPILQQRIRHRLINAVCILLYALIYNLHQHLRKRISFARSCVQHDILQNVPQDFFPVWGDKTTPLS